MNNIEQQYLALLQDIIDNGKPKEDRTGTGTISVFGRQLRHDFRNGFPLLTTKRIPFDKVVTELLWFLRGDTNIKYLVDNNCHIWDGDAYKNFKSRFSQMPSIQSSLPTKEEFIDKIKNQDGYAELWGELGPIYGAQWRSWNKYDDYVDQISNLISELKTNPDSRRLMVNAWNVGELNQMVLPPCHYGFQVYTRELSLNEREQIALKIPGVAVEIEKRGPMTPLGLDKNNIPTRAISLMWNQRSVDTFLGLPFNIASYGLLLEIIAKEVNMIPDELIGNLGDVHLYSNHIEQAKEQIGRDLTDEERYNIWFDNNYETGMERFFDPNNLPDFDNDYYKPTPKRTREPYPLPTLKIENEVKWVEGDCLPYYSPSDFSVENYQSHPTIKAPLSN